jgi:serine protease Do
MTNRILSAALLALVGVAGPLAAQSKSPRVAPERDDARRMARTIVSRLDADPDRPRLGITAVAGSASDTLGILVDGVTAGGPAEKAGLRQGDRLVAINDVTLRLDPADADDAGMHGVTMRRLTRELSRHAVGDQVELQYVRDGRTQSAKVTTAAPDDVQRTVSWAGAGRRSADRASLGVGLGGSTGMRDTLGIFVTRVSKGGPAEVAGVIEGDRLAAINGVDLRVPREDADDGMVALARIQRLNRELDRLKAGDTVSLRVVRGGAARTVRVTTVAARELERTRGGAFMIGDGLSLRSFDFATVPTPPLPPIPPTPDTPPTPPTPRTPPLPPEAPELFFFDRDADGPIRLRMSAPLRSELRGELPSRAREALERALEIAPRVRGSGAHRNGRAGRGRGASGPGRQRGARRTASVPHRELAGRVSSRAEPRARRGAADRASWVDRPVRRDPALKANAAHYDGVD